MSRSKLGFIAPLSWVIVACSSSPEPAPGPSTTGSPGTGSITGSPTTTTPTVPTPVGTTPTPTPSGTPTSPGTPAAGACNAQTTGETCYECCDQQNAAGLAVMTQLWDQCVCTKCQAQCAASVCSTSPSEAPDGSPCATCMDNAGCDEQVEPACAANASCAALTNCYETSQCDTKP